MASALSVLVPAVGWALLHFIWQGLLIGWGVSIALFLLRKARPQARYAVACAGLLLCAALPLASIIVQVNAADAAAHGGFTPGTSLLRPVLSAGADAAQSGVAAAGALIDDGTLAGWEAALRGQLGWLVGLWLAGAALMSLRLAIGLKWVADRTRSDHYTVNHYWQRRLSEMARRFDIAQHVRLGVADLLDSPITAGCWRPIVLVPASLITGMAPNLLEALLAHELAHIKRRDYLINLIQSAVEIALFYHPSVWALSRRIRVEREQIADDLAVTLLGQPQMLAKALSELDKFQFDTTQLAHAAHGGNLMSRIKRLLRPDVEPVSWKMAVPLIGLFAATAVFYVQAAPQPSPAMAGAVAAVEAAPGAAPAADMAELPAPPELPEPALPPAPPEVSEVAGVAGVAGAPPAAPAAPALPAAPAAPAMPAMPAAPALPALPAIPPAPAAPPLPAAPAAPAAPFSFGDSAINLSVNSGDRAYAIVARDTDQVHVAGSSDDLRRIAELRSSIKGDFVWYREGGKTYLIHDPAVLAQVRQLWKPVSELGERMDAQGKRIDLQAKVMDGLAARIDALTRDFDSGPVAQERQRLERRMEALAARQEAIAERMVAASETLSHDQSKDGQRKARELQAAMHREMAPVQREMAQMQRDMAEKMAGLHRNQAPMKALNLQIAEANKPMAELGRRMGELGREQARASREAERNFKALVRDAIRNGKAVPAQGLM